MLVTLEILQKTLDKYQEVYQEVEILNTYEDFILCLYENKLSKGMCEFIIDLIVDEKRFVWNSYVSDEMGLIYKKVLGESRKKRVDAYWFPIPSKYKTKKGILSSLLKRIEFLKQAVEYGTKNNLWRNS